MRKYLRKIAHENMKKLGIKKINKPRVDQYGRLKSSAFAELWRKYC